MSSIDGRGVDEEWWSLSSIDVRGVDEEWWSLSSIDVSGVDEGLCSAMVPQRLHNAVS